MVTNKDFHPAGYHLPQRPEAGELDTRSVSSDQAPPDSWHVKKPTSWLKAYSKMNLQNFERKSKIFDEPTTLDTKDSLTDLLHNSEDTADRQRISMSSEDGSRSSERERKK